MTSFQSLSLAAPDFMINVDERSQRQLLAGEVLTQTQPYSAWGGAVTAFIYLPKGRSHVWQQLTNYPRWVQFFPDMIRSEIVAASSAQSQGYKRLYQVAQKAFLMFTAKVEVYLRVAETTLNNTDQIQFRFERGDFSEFSADLRLQDYQTGTLLTYSVKATPSIPVPAMFIQEAMKMDLPANLRRMRQVICDRP
ncbi:MAG TPA: SRPBCC family protein [Chroococcidiopsis sp.]